MAHPLAQHGSGRAAPCRARAQGRVRVSFLEGDVSFL